MRDLKAGSEEIQRLASIPFSFRMFNLNPVHDRSIAFGSVILNALVIFLYSHGLTLHAVDV